MCTWIRNKTRNSVCEVDFSTQEEGGKITQSIPKSHPISTARGEQGSGSELLDSARFSIQAVSSYSCYCKKLSLKFSLSSHVLLFKCIARGSDLVRLSSLLYIGMYIYTHVLLTLQVHHWSSSPAKNTFLPGSEKTMTKSNFPAP